MSSVKLELDRKSLAGLKRSLAKLDRDVSRSIADKALMAGAEPIERDAKERVSRRTGKGAKSIERAPQKSKGGSRVRTVAVGPSVGTQSSRRDGFYLRFLELGTVPRYTKGGAFRGQIAEGRYAFLRPAFDAQEGAAVRAARDELRRGIEKAAR